MFFTQTFSMDNGSGSYMGLQQEGDGRRQVRFSIWGATAFRESMVEGAACRRFGGEGVGMTCTIPYAWETGRWYRLRVWMLETDAEGQWWGAWVMDDTGREQRVGDIRAPGPGLITATSSFNEYFGPAAGLSCGHPPPSSVYVYQPLVDDDSSRAAASGGSLLRCSGGRVTELWNGELARLDLQTDRVVGPAPPAAPPVGAPGPPSDPGGTDGDSGGPAGGGDGSGDGGGGTNGGGGNDDDDDDDRGGPGGNEDDSGDGDGSGDAGGAVRASFTLDAPCADGLCRARTGVPVSFLDRSSGAVTSRNWSLGDGTTSRGRSLEHAWSVPGFYTVSLTVSGHGPSSTVSRKLLVVAADPVGTCAADGETLCLQDSRFSVTMDWWTEDGAAGRRGPGKVVHEGTNDSGLFWFFSSVNWELLVKVLDGCSVNGRMWVYGASATTLGYVLMVTDTVTGAVQEYRNEPGRQAEAFTDSAAFPGSCTDAATTSAAAGDSGSLPVTAPSPGPLPEPPPAQRFAAGTVSVAAPAEEDGCTDTATAMCLQKGRYEVTVEWSNLDGMRGKGRTAGPRTDDSGLFHFFSPANWEILVKVLDGCSFNDRHWVFAASATDVGFDLRVRDTATGRTRLYTKEPDRPARALVDISAFPEGCRKPS